ncbi:MAG TPA: hypothetical protein VG841_10155 [Caulobacterales bacterium]|nr:hypothetical protein [Caulobacterales bacterium]
MRAIAPMLMCALTLSGGGAFAQSADPDAMMARFEATQAAAAAQAQHPGDDQLTCDQIQTEMTSTMSDPAVQTQIQQMGAWAQEQQQRADAGRAQAGAQIVGNMALGLASSFVPWLGYSQMAAQRAQMSQMQNRADDAQARADQLMSGMEGVMPQLMRGQRLYELAQGQQCAFLQEQGAPAP